MVGSTQNTPQRNDVKSHSGKLGHGKKLFSFGVIADVQHADIDDGASYAGTPRYYRNSVIALRRAVDDWCSNPGVQFVVNLGDIIDGFAKDHSVAALTNVLTEFDRLDRPVYHAIGNHCLTNFPRAELNQRLGIPSIQQGSYFSVLPQAGWRLIVLDAYELSMLGWPKGHPKYELAQQILNANNPNEDKNNPNPMEGVARRFVKFGGGVGVEQLAWLERQLEELSAAGEHAIICCHVALHPDTCPGAALLWNYEEVLSLLHKYDQVVVATLAGHVHKDGFATDELGIHHRVLHGVVETPPGTDCHGVVDVYSGALVLRGQGALESVVMPFSRDTRPQQALCVQKPLRAPVVVEATNAVAQLSL